MPADIVLSVRSAERQRKQQERTTRSGKTKGSVWFGISSVKGKWKTISLPCKELAQTKSQNNLLQSLKSSDQPLITHQSQIVTKNLLKEKQFKLAEEEFHQVMYTHRPEVPTLRGKMNRMFSEGSENEVQLGAAKLEGLINQILEKRVKLPADLITFIKSSCAISKYETRFHSYRNPVFMEVGSDLVLFSLSSDDLDEALAAVVRDLSVEIVKLQGAAAVPPDLDRLKEILTTATNKENCRELRVDFSIIPGSGTAGTKVRLVGYSENVSKLADVLRDFQTNQVTTQEAINLLHPEMVDCFDKILDLIGTKQTKVTLKASHLPNPHVLISGPRCHVPEAKQALMPALTSLTIETLALDGPGAKRYFKAEGKMSKELVESSCCVIIQEKRVAVTPNVITRSYVTNPITVTTQTSNTRSCSKTPAGMVVNKTRLENKVGSLVEQFYHDIYQHRSLNMNQRGQVSVSQLPPLQQRRTPVNTGLSALCTTRQQSVFLVLGHRRKSVNDAMTKVKDLYQAHCSTQNITKEQLADLTQDEIKDLRQVVETQGLHVQQDQRGDGGLIVSGLKDGVTKLMEMLNSIACLRIEVRDREEGDLYPRVAWCILGHDGNWERLPKTANHNLEKGNIMKGIEDTQGNSWSVDLQKMEAKTGFRQTKLKRLENHSDFTLPLHWDSMAIGENWKVVALESSSAEYVKILMAFTQTVQRTVKKIERLQNVHLRQGYEVQKKKLSEKNRLEGGAGEKLLYHGTSQDSCESIIKHGFNRSFSGKNATAYGQGTYFAVNASYSASPTYSKPAADGSQAVFVAQVLTGIYTQGRSDMRIPPPRDNKPDDRYDSVVDCIVNPSMFIVFNDNQAYPDYLITFC